MDISKYKVGIVLSVDEPKSKSGSKPLKTCTVNIGGDNDGSNPITVVTAASNVRTGSRIVVAPVGSTVINDEGEEMEVKRSSVGGVMSDGIFCDGRMLGWAGGAQGIAAQVPDSFEPGSAPPSTKPGAPGSQSPEAPAGDVQGLFEKKLTKEEKKKLAEERRKTRKDKKAAKDSGKEES